MVFGINIKQTSIERIKKALKDKKEITIKKPGEEAQKMTPKVFRDELADDVKKRGGVNTKESLDRMLKKEGIKDTDDNVEIRKRLEKEWFPEENKK
jgi:hypothetical protein